VFADGERDEADPVQLTNGAPGLGGVAAVGACCSRRNLDELFFSIGDARGWKNLADILLGMPANRLFAPSSKCRTTLEWLDDVVLRDGVSHLPSTSANGPWKSFSKRKSASRTTSTSGSPAS
jgi:hypothetical protein